MHTGFRVLDARFEKPRRPNHFAHVIATSAQRIAESREIERLRRELTERRIAEYRASASRALDAANAKSERVRVVSANEARYTAMRDLAVVMSALAIIASATTAILAYAALVPK